MHHCEAEFFDDWRDTARRLVLEGIAPEAVRWIDVRSRSDGQGDLFGGDVDAGTPNGPAAVPPAGVLKVPAAFLAIARTVSHHRSPGRWSLLYRMLWRIHTGQRGLLNIASDPDVLDSTQMEKAVRRDAHKMKAFVRFRRLVTERGDHYVAWHRPDHYSLRYTCEFFARRFDVMRWTILTPDESVNWDGRKLTFGPGVPRSEAPRHDELEELWKTYYAHIFNPARIKLKAMQAEMPKKHWPTMPETELIDKMLRDAPRRVEQMIAYSEGIATAEHFLSDPSSLEALRADAARCQGCDLCREATRTVFGTGPADAAVVLVGEQPGDQEDLRGVPFVGPAGQILDDMLRRAGIDRRQTYVTNAVKHFKFTRSGKRRLHKRPSSREIAACRPWLDAELALIDPRVVVCLGATAAGVVLGKNFRLTDQRGQFLATDYAPLTIATYHPSALLRADDASGKKISEAFLSDLRRVAEVIAEMPPRGRT